jgi:hypothetical protein
MEQLDVLRMFFLFAVPPTYNIASSEMNASEKQGFTFTVNNNKQEEKCFESLVVRQG